MKKRTIRSNKSSFFWSLRQKIFWRYWKKSKKKKIRTRQKKGFSSKVRNKFYRWQKLIIVCIIVWVTALVIYFISKNTFLAKSHTIEKVSIDPWSIDEYDNEDIFVLIQDQLLWKNYYKLRWSWKEQALNEVQKEFSLVKNFDITHESDSLWYVTIDYHEPTLIFLLPEQRRYAAYDNKLYQLWTWDYLWSESPVIELPKYTQELENIEWIFHQIDEKRLLEVYSIVINTLWENNISEVIYLPWWQKLFLSYKWKRLYIHVNKDINIQLAKLIDLENFYTRFNNISVIDLWSVDDTIVK